MPTKSDPQNEISQLRARVRELEKNQESLRESEASLRAVADFIPHIIWSARPDGAVDYINAHGLEKTGVRIEQIEGWNFLNIVHPDDVEPTIATWTESLRTGKPYRLEYRARLANGQYRWLYIHGVAQRDEQGRIVRWFGTITDIHERKAAQDRLRFQLSLMEAITSNAADALLLVDRDSTVTFMNPAAERMLGWRHQELVGRNFHTTVHYQHPEGAPYPVEECALHSVFTTGRTLTAHEDVFYRKDGSSLDVSCSSAPVLHGGEVKAAVLVVSDISERKRSEERLRQAQRLEGIGLLAGGIAHDFNNLLTSILGSATLLEEWVPPDGRRLLDNILQGAERAADLTRQLLAYAGKGQFVLRKLDLSAEVRDMAELLRISVSRSVQLKLGLDEDVPPIMADAGQIEQVIMNLVINAAESVGEQPDGSVAVATRAREVHRAFLDDLGEEVRPGSYACLEVTDNGCGMDEQTRSRIFDPFFTTKFTGRGLGLAAVSGIMRSQKGAVTIRTVPGEGTTFTLYFPAFEDAAPGTGPSS